MNPSFAADLVVVLHLAFIVFVAVGGLLVLRWPRLAWAHVPAFIWGALVELDLRHCNYNFINTLSRRREAYHRQFTEEKTVQTEEGIKDRPASIHDLKTETEEGLMRFLTYDRYERTAFLDRFMPPALTLDEYLEAGLPECGDFLEGRYLLKSARQDRKKGVAVLEMAREGSITIDGTAYPLSLVKQYRFQTAEPSIEVSWALKSLSDKPLDFKMGGEVNFSLNAGLCSPRPWWPG